MRRLALLCLPLLTACYDASIANMDESDACACLDADVDASDAWAPPVPFDGDVPPDDPGPGVMLYEVTALDLGADANTGFDVDGFDTRSLNDPVGCGILDGEGGIDNRLENLLSIGTTFGFDLGSLLLGTSFDLLIEIRGYEGVDGDWVRADILSGGEIIAENAPGRVDGGVVEIHFDELPLPASPASLGTFALPLRFVRVSFDIDEPAATEALLGGAIVWDDGTEEDLESLVQSLIERFAGTSFPVAVVETIIVGNLDIALEGPGTACDAISLASFLTVQRVMP